MRFMFGGCWSLEEINISNFNFDNVINMTGMFDDCKDEIKKKVKSQNNKINDDAMGINTRR